MSEQALYRKYRSATFAEVVGQEHVVTTLTSALASGRLSHAYLFTGPRGVGKTSVARLLARALNCTGEPKPCNKCPLCLAAINSSLDIVEIDAASNRSIDSIRDLRDKIALAPTQGKYKIYIIDEVHMLTTEAFNALLKTLEEPPAHAVFVLATTEAHKIPETIISRTQSFNFKPITEADIISHLRRIASSENIQVDDEALGIVAAYARGGFRDAISTLDQLAASGASPITAATVRSLIGYSSAEEISAVSRSIINHDPGAALATLAHLAASGAQAAQVATQLADQWRAIMAAASGMPTSDDAVQALTKLLNAAEPSSGGAAARTAAGNIAQLLDVIRSPWPQLALEAAVVAICIPQQAAGPTPVALAAPPAATGPHKSAPARPAPSPQAAPAAQPAPTAQPQAAPAAPGTLDAKLWAKVLVLIKSKNNSLCALLQMYPIDFAEGEVTIKPRFNFHRDLFLKHANRTTIEQAAAKVYNRPVKVHARTVSTDKPRTARPDAATELVSSALEILGGEIVE